MHLFSLVLSYLFIKEVQYIWITEIKIQLLLHYLKKYTINIFRQFHTLLFPHLNNIFNVPPASTTVDRKDSS